MGKSKYESHLLLVIYNIQANLDAMVFYYMFSGKLKFIAFLFLTLAQDY